MTSKQRVWKNSAIPVSRVSSVEEYANFLFTTNSHFFRLLIILQAVIYTPAMKRLLLPTSISGKRQAMRCNQLSHTLASSFSFLLEACT